MSSKYIHIGFPKNFSTSLQRSYFSAHPELLHLGIGLDNNNLGYRDTTVEKALEVYLKSCKDYKYNEVEHGLKQHFNTYFEAGKLQNKKVGISAEHLSFSFSYDSISSQIKAQRLFNIFGADTTIVMVVRNQWELIKSLFRESIRVGYAGDFQEYLYLFYKYQDRNYYYDIAYTNAYLTYTDLFGKENVKILFFENYRNEDGSLVGTTNDSLLLIDDLNSVLGLSELVDFQHFNKALNQKELEAKRMLNRTSHHDLSNHLLESAEKHRIKQYLIEDLNVEEPEDKLYEDVATKRALIEMASHAPSNKNLDYSCHSEIKEKMAQFYLEDNSKLETLLHIDLPNQYSKRWE